MGGYSAKDARAFRVAEIVGRASIARPDRASWLSGTSTASLSRILWTRALPGSAVVLASFGLPGLSLGADFFAEGSSTGAAQGRDAQKTTALGEAAKFVPALTVRTAAVQADSARPHLRFVLAPEVAAPSVTAPKPAVSDVERLAAPSAPMPPVEALAPLPAVPAAIPAPAAMAAAPVLELTEIVPDPPTASAPQPASSPVPVAPPAALAPLPQAKPQLPAAAAGRVDALRVDIKSQLLARIDGKSAGTIDFRQTEAGLQVRLGSIADLLGDRYDAAQLARIKASSASNVYLSLADLQAQGIPISYDPVYDEFNVGTLDARPKARMKVHMDQISTPERGLGSTAMEQLRR